MDCSSWVVILYGLLHTLKPTKIYKKTFKTL